MYCSELVWKIYYEVLRIEIGELQTIKDFDLSNFIVQKKKEERFGKNIPINEMVISPESIFNSKLLYYILL